MMNKYITISSITLVLLYLGTNSRSNIRNKKDFNCNAQKSYAIEYAISELNKLQKKDHPDSHLRISDISIILEDYRINGNEAFLTCKYKLSLSDKYSVNVSCKAMRDIPWSRLLEPIIVNYFSCSNRIDLQEDLLKIISGYH